MLRAIDIDIDARAGVRTDGGVAKSLLVQVKCQQFFTK